MAKKDRGVIGGLLDLAGGAIEGLGRITPAGRGSAARTAGKQLQNDQTRLANALNQLKIIAGTNPDNASANIQANEVFKKAGLPVQEGADFSPFLDKFRAGTQVAPTREAVLSRPTPAVGTKVKTTTRGGEEITREGVAVKQRPATDVFTLQVGGQGVESRIDRDPQGNITGFTPLQVEGEAAVAAPSRQEVRTGAIESGTKSTAEKDIVSLTQRREQVKALKQTVQQDPSLLTFPRKAQGFVTDVVEFFGGKTTNKIEKLLQDANITNPAATQKLRDFQASAENAFLPFRKFITGVAGGMKEFSEIAKAFPREDDTLSEFLGKADAAIRATTVLGSILEAAITDGVLTQAEVDSGTPNPEVQQRLRDSVFSKMTNAGVSLSELPEIRQGEGVNSLIQRAQLRKFSQGLKDNEVLMQDQQGNISAFTRQELDQGLGQGFTPVTGF